MTITENTQVTNDPIDHHSLDQLDQICYHDSNAEYGQIISDSNPKQSALEIDSQEFFDGIRKTRCQQEDIYMIPVSKVFQSRINMEKRAMNIYDGFLAPASQSDIDFNLTDNIICDNNNSDEINIEDFLRLGTDPEETLSKEINPYNGELEECCGDRKDEERDLGLDSTLSLSINEEQKRISTFEDSQFNNTEFNEEMQSFSVEKSQNDISQLSKTRTISSEIKLQSKSIKKQPKSPKRQKITKIAKKQKNDTQLSINLNNNISQIQKKLEDIFLDETPCIMDDLNDAVEGIYQKRVTKMDVANAKNEKYYKQFDFFFNRSCFRIFTEFFKNKFNQFYAEKMTELKQVNFQMWQQNVKAGGLTATPIQEIDEMVREFISHIFGPEILRQNSELSDLERQQFVHSMMQIIFSHRYNKGDRFLAELQAQNNLLPNNVREKLAIDFTLVRDTMYKYSKKSYDRFFSYPIESFIFASFALSDEGLQFLDSKQDIKADGEKLMKIRKDLRLLKKQAMNQLNNLNQSQQETQSPKFGLFLNKELQRLTSKN